MKQNGFTAFTSAWLSTIESILKDRAVLLLLLVAPVVYAFFTPGRTRFKLSAGCR